MPRTIVGPLQRALGHEAAGGIVMLLAAAVAIAWANSPWSDTYVDLWSTPLRVELGDIVHIDHLSRQDWVNEALMTAFFLLVGIEIKREVVHGDLRDARAAALPLVAALGGMIVPAVIYAAFNAGGPGADGWAIPMATDVAFAVGVVTLLGRRVPPAAKVFLLTLAVVDDIGAIVVIAIFYTGSLSWDWLAWAGAGLAVIFAVRRAGVQALAPYVGIGAFVWLALLESGVHATLTGVALGLLTPAGPRRSPRRFPTEVRGLLDRTEAGCCDRLPTGAGLDTGEQHISEGTRLSVYATSPAARLERGLSAWVAYAIVPVFALANAGVALTRDALGGIVSEPVTAGVALGLVAGKTAGVLGASALAVRLGVGRLPAGATWRHMLGLAAVAGVGFTVALFVTTLSFDEPAAADAAKVGILAGSALAGALGYLVLRSVPADPGPT